MTLHQGFSVTSIPAASEVAGIQALGRVAARASTTLTSTEGRYDLGLRYFDESDGVASLAISLNGAVLDEWRWSRLTGSTAPTADSLFTRTVRGIDLAPGDVIELSGRGDFGEPLRIDNLVLTPVDLLV